MPYQIGKQGDQYCVEKYSPTGASEPVEGGCHATEAAANEHLRALYANVTKSTSRAMLAFYPSGDIGQILYQATVDAQVTPQPVGELHMTLINLGAGISPEQENALVTVLRDFVDQQQGLDAVLNGVGRFRNTELNAVYANVDSGSLPTFRQKLWDLVQQCGIEPPNEHGFTPHITLAYVPNDMAIKEIMLQPTFIHMTAIALVNGENRTLFQLAGYPRESLMEEKEKKDPALFAYVPDQNESSKWELPIHDADHVARAISALSSRPQHGQGAKIPADQRAGVLAKISARIGHLPIDDDKKKHLRAELVAIKALKNTPASAVPDATPLHGPFPGNAQQFGIFSSPGVKRGIQKLVDRFGKKKDVALTVGNKGYISPISMGLQDNVGIFKGLDGLRYMFIITSNSYKDREQETITTKALQSYVEDAWIADDKCLPNNPLLVWHGGEPIGDIVYCRMEGPFLVEIAKERTNKAIRLNRFTKTTIKAVWDAIERDKTTRWGASHGYEYPPAAKDKQHVYHAIKKFETSVLPLQDAANPYTFSGVINMNNRDKFLNKLLGIPDAAANIRKGVRSVEHDLEKRGLQHKEVKVKGILEELEAVIDEALSKITDNPDPSMKEELLEAIVSKLAGAAPDALGEADMDETYDNMDEPDEMKAEETPDEDAPKSDGAAQMGKAYKLMDKLVNSQALQADQMERITKAIEALAPITQLPAKVDKQFTALTARLDAVEKRLGGRPRQASRDVETAVEDKALTQKVLEQAAEVDSFWNTRLTPNK